MYQLGVRADGPMIPYVICSIILNNTGRSTWQQRKTSSWTQHLMHSIFYLAKFCLGNSKWDDKKRPLITTQLCPFGTHPFQSLCFFSWLQELLCVNMISFSCLCCRVGYPYIKRQEGSPLVGQENIFLGYPQTNTMYLQPINRWKNLTPPLITLSYMHPWRE
jgi:hypothetical protein